MNKKKQIRVLIADDSALMRILIGDIIKTDTSIEVVGQASNGRSAYWMTKDLKPDVVLMDITMGEYDGLYGVTKIMEVCPTPIIILSAVGNTDMDPIMKALELGAIDYLNKPAKNRVNMHEVRTELIDKIKVASEVMVQQLVTEAVSTNVHEHSFSEEVAYSCIVVGASTGGPRAIEKILTHLPKNLTVPIIIAQHMPASFVNSFAQRLNLLTPLTVTVATKGTLVQAGHVFLAPGNANLVVRLTDGAIVFGLTAEQFRPYNNPSIDGLMFSIASVYKQKAIGVLLSGMGRDGAMGLKAIKDAGGYTIAQNEASCIVYGMPRAALNKNAVRELVHLDDIAGFLVSCLS